MPSHCVIPENVHTCTSPIEGIFSKTPLPLPTPLEIPIKLHTFLYILGSYRTPHPTGSSNPFCGRGGIDIFWTCTLSQTSRLSFWASNCLLSLAWWARHQASHLLTKSLKRKLRITQGKQNLRALCPSSELEIKFFSSLVLADRLRTVQSYIRFEHLDFFSLLECICWS